MTGAAFMLVGFATITVPIGVATCMAIRSGRMIGRPYCAVLFTKW